MPGTVLASFYNIGAVPDPNFGDNIFAISDSFFYSDFWYRNEFTAPPASATATISCSKFRRPAVCSSAKRSSVGSTRSPVRSGRMGMSAAAHGSGEIGAVFPKKNEPISASGKRFAEIQQRSTIVMRSLLSGVAIIAALAITVPASAQRSGPGPGAQTGTGPSAYPPGGYGPSSSALFNAQPGYPYQTGPAPAGTTWPTSSSTGAMPPRDVPQPH